MTPDMVVIAICQETGWTYDEYMEQPSWFLELLKEKLQTDSRKIQREIDKAKHIRRKSNAGRY